MPLKKLHEKLYYKDKDKKKKKIKTEYSNSENSQGASFKKREPLLNWERETLLKKEKPDFRKEEQNIEDKKKFRLYLIIGSVVFISLVILIGLGIVFYGKYKESLFDPERVIVDIIGTKEIDSGRECSYKFKITNNNKVDLGHSKLKIDIPSELELKENEFTELELATAAINIGKIKAKGSKEYELNFNVFGAKNSQIYLKGILDYQPEGFNAFFESRNQIDLLIKSSALQLDIVASQEASQGELVEYRIYIENKSKKPLKNLVLNAEYPEEFSYYSGEPQSFSDNHIWRISEIEAFQQKEIVIKGTLKGSIDAVKKFSAVIGVGSIGDNFTTLNKAETNIKIIKPRVEINQTINGKSDLKSVKAGDVLKFVINFKNTSEEPLRDLILTEKMESRVIDEASYILPRGGHYDEEKNTIIWKASDISQLKNLNPQKEGQVAFRVQVKEILPVENEGDENFIIQASPAIESLDVDSPLWENKKIGLGAVSLKVQSKLLLEISGNYNDGELANEGPMPLAQGEKTTFTLRFSLLNTSNDLKDVVIKTALPTGVTWEENYLPQETGVEFNERTNELTWKVGSLKAGTGFRIPVRSLAFQVGVTPSEYQLEEGDKKIGLINQIKATAFDTFLGENVEYDYKEFRVLQINDY